MNSHRAYRRLGKRIFDVALAAIALVLLSPVMALIAAGVRLSIGRPVLFRQIRPGRDAMPFQIIKFRTMADGRDDEGAVLGDGARLTWFGVILRKTSIDELPTLVNVIRGDMSLVGPRPLLMRYLPHYTAVERRRFAIRPGITGLAQVSGRNDLPWEERLAHDAWYVDHYSFALDLRILAKTVAQVLRGRGVKVDSRMDLPDFDVARKRARD